MTWNLSGLLAVRSLLVLVMGFQIERSVKP